MSFDGGVGAVPHEGNACTGRIEGVAFFRGEAGVFGSQELAEVGGVGGAGDGDNPGVAGEDPGQGELCGGEVFACRPLADKGEEGFIVFERFRREARQDGASIEQGKAAFGGEAPGEIAAANGGVGHEPDAERLKGGKDFGFRFSPPDGVFAFYGGEGLNRMCAADGGGRGLG